MLEGWKEGRITSEFSLEGEDQNALGAGGAVGSGRDGWTGISFQWSSHCNAKGPAIKTQPCFLMFVEDCEDLFS